MPDFSETSVSTKMVDAMSVKDLKTFLGERGVSLVGVTEKSELVALARTAQEQDAKSGIVRHAPASAPTLPKGVISIGDKTAWAAIHQRAGAALVVVDFTATWCGPCKQIGPKFHAMADEFTGVVFASVDVDANAEVSQECDVKCMPTFQFFRNGKVRCRLYRFCECGACSMQRNGQHGACAFPAGALSQRE
jgi:thioredoxin 1